MEIAPLADKWRAFGWHVPEIDGHGMPRSWTALDQATATRGGRAVIIARTVKGKGVSFMENEVGWHAGRPTHETGAGTSASWSSQEGTTWLR